MSHEQSETIQLPNGRWVNVYGRALPSAGQQLPGSSDFGTVEDAVMAAKTRSSSFDHAHSRESGPSVNTFGDRVMGKVGAFHESMNLRNLAERMDPKGTVNKLFRRYGPKSPTINLDEGRQLEQLRQMEEPRDPRY